MDVGAYHVGDVMQVTPAYTVTAAENHALGRREVLRTYHNMDGLDLRAVQAEAQALASLTHRCCPRVLNAGFMTAQGVRQLVISFERVDGVSLAERLQRSGPLTPLRVYRLGLRALEACAEAHAAGLAIGPVGNGDVLISASAGEDRLRLRQYSLGQLGAPIGRDQLSAILEETPQAVAPEQHLGGLHSEAADLFSIGAWMYEALAGSPAFDGPLPALLRALRRGQQAAPMPPWSRVPDPLAAVVMRALQVRPLDRYPSAAAMRDALLELDLEPLLRTASVPEQRFARATTARPSVIAAPIPELWVFTDGPEFKPESVRRALASLEKELRLVHLDADARAALLPVIADGICPAPWAVCFGDMHVLLDDPLLLELNEHPLTSRVLLSSHPNLELLQMSIACCGLDGALLSTMSADALARGLRAAVSRGARLRGLTAKGSAARGLTGPTTAPSPPLAPSPSRPAAQPPAQYKLGVRS